MAFPIVVATNTSTEAIDTTTHTVALPAGLQAGHLIIVLVAQDSYGATPTFTGYTLFGGNAVAGALRTDAYYRVADGTEGSSDQFTTSVADQSAHISFIIDDYLAPGTQVPESANTAEAAATDPDPPNLTPTGGSKDYLWIAWEGADAALATASPAGYGTLLTAGSGTTVGISAAVRSLAAASENPGVFTQVFADNRASTSVVHPGSEGPAAVTTTRKLRVVTSPLRW